MRSMASAILLAVLTFVAGALLPAPAKAWDDGYGGGYVTYRSYRSDCAPRYRYRSHYSRPYRYRSHYSRPYRYRSYSTYRYVDDDYYYRRPRYRTRYYDGGYDRPRYYRTRHYSDWYDD